MLTAAVIGYQFAKIGNDQVAQDMVQRLDDDDKLRDYIDCMGTFSGCYGHHLGPSVRPRFFLIKTL